MMDGLMEHGRSAVVAACAVLAILASPAPARAAGALADAAARKAAVKCQALLTRTTGKALAAKLKAFEACSAAALACVQTKSAKADCPTKAAATCTKKLGGATAAAAKARAKLASDKSCLALSTGDLLAADGLGFGAIAADCAADFQIDVCEGIEPVAACLLAGHDLAAGGLAGRAAPRTSELLGLLPGAPLSGAAGLPPLAGCGGCGAPPDARKGVETCGKALGAGARAVASAFENAFGACTLAHYACVQTKGGDAACTTAATAACTKAAGKAAKAVTKLGTAATKACGPAFAAASAASGANLDVLASRCADLGVAALGAPDAVAACLAAEARCTVAELARTALPRTVELDPAALGALAGDLGATCPLPPGLTKGRGLAAGAPQPRIVFGSILKIMKSVTRAVPSAVGVRATGGKPASTGGGTGISKISGPGRVTFGAINKYKVTYHGARSRAGGGLANGAPPVLIVTVSRPDILLDDHFELPLLDLPMDGGDVEDEIDVEFADTLPECAFDLSFATKAGGEVSDYASILQVLDEPGGPTKAALELVSRGPGGVQQNAAFDAPTVAISANGRYVLFGSTATNLVATPDTAGEAEVFLRDRCVDSGIPIAGCTPATTLESRGADGTDDLHTGAIGHLGVSDDGRYVAFDAVSSGGPTTGPTLFVKDRCLSHGAPPGSCANFTDFVPNYDASSTATGFSMTSDGRYFAFTNDTSYPVPAATPIPMPQVQVWDRCVSTASPVNDCSEGPELVSRRLQDGTPGNAPSTWAAISRGGRFVAFRSDASDLLFDDDTNGANDVYLRDRCILDGEFLYPCDPDTRRINLGPDAAPSAGDDPATPPLTNVAVSQNGRWVAFTSTASDLLADGVDTNGKRDLFVRDTCLADGQEVLDCSPSMERANVGPNGSESNGDIPGGQTIGMSADGRFLVFASDATNLLGGAVGVPNGLFQIFLRDRCIDPAGIAIPGCTPSTTLVSAAPDKGLGTASSSHPAISEGGSTTAFISGAANLLGPGADTNGVADVFARDR